ncbi:HigA family addiction module antidote protein, partial [Patescibacteria group bacterium]|nr:HigA family addiction module antidote protein [Patescibacteria group bacterium]
IRNKRSISANTALRLSKFFGTSAEFWLNLQSNYDLAIESDKLEKELKIEVKVFDMINLKSKA